MNGIIVINKSKGCTSHDIIKRAKRILNEKVGHTGTLDPNATGVLPLLVGKGTQISKYIINHDKTYEAILQLGTKTDTADGEGNILETGEVSEESLQQINIDKVFKSLIGKQNQVPPMYSAIKVNGKKLYEYARRGEHVEIQPRTIEIYNIELIRTDLQNKTIEFRVYCSKGTYIRTLCENIAERLHTIGYMKELNRIKVGEFKIEDSIRIEELEKNIHNNFITIEEYFDKSKSIELDNKRLQLFLNGVQLTWKLEDGVYKIYSDSQFIGIGTIKNSLLKRDIIL
ncbi:MAG: tRNA pseudouridine(55) synthase TruB [Clostridia bacterium]